MFEAAKRATAHRIKKKKTLSLDDLNKIFVKLNQNKTNLEDQRLLTIILIAFCGFMRFSEVSRLRRSDFVLVALTARSSSRKVRQTFIGKEYGFTSQLLVKFVHYKNLNITWLSQKYPKIQRRSFSEAYVEAKNSACAQKINRFHIAESERILSKF